MAALDGSFDGLFALAELHGVTGQLAAKLAHAATAPKRDRFADSLRDAHRVQLLSTMQRIAELFRVLEILNPAAISSVVIKGPVLSTRAFSDPSARHYGDIDFLLRGADIVRATQLLAAAGFTPAIPVERIQSQKQPGQHMFRRSENAPLIELHTERTLRYFPRPLPVDDFFRRQTTVTIDGRAVPALSLEDEFVLISIHGAKHFWERLMWIADVAALVRNCPQMDWSRVQKTASAVGSERMVRVALLLAQRTLNSPVPAEWKKGIASDPACLRIVKKIESWLPYAGEEPPALMQRALFRFQMRGRLFAGARYLTRLSLSPTEEDWDAGAATPAGSLRESLRRPFRLARKYRRTQKETGKG